MAKPGSGLYPSVELGTNYATGESPVNTNLRKKAFGSSPLFNEYDLNALITLANKVLNSKTEPVVGNKLFPNFVLKYNETAPDISKTPSGGAGLPGTGFTPTIASPGAGNGVSPNALPNINLTVDDLNSFRKTPVIPGQTEGTQNPINSQVGVEVGNDLKLGKSK